MISYYNLIPIFQIFNEVEHLFKYFLARCVLLWNAYNFPWWFLLLKFICRCSIYIIWIPLFFFLLHWVAGGILIPSVYVYVLSCSIMSNSLRPHGLQHARFMGILQVRIVEWVAMPSSRGIFPIQALKPGFPHCRQILYHLSHEGSPECWGG